MTEQEIINEAEKRYPRDDVISYYSRKSFIEGASFASIPRFKDVEWAHNDYVWVATCGEIEIGTVFCHPEFNNKWACNCIYSSDFIHWQESEEEAKAAVESSWNEFCNKITK